MSHLTLEQRLAYIVNLELADAPRARLIAADEGEDGAAVNAGSVVSFVANVGSQHREDALNSTLFAQLGANAAWDRYAEPVNWYKKYNEIMENVGWVIQEFSFDKLHSNSASFTVDKVLLELLAALMSEDEARVLEEAINALKALSGDSNTAKIFENSSHDYKKANAQLGVASDEDGVLVMKMGFFYVSTVQNITRVLWFEFKSGESDMFKAKSSINLNEQVYGQVRQTVIDKLGARAKKYIDDLPLGD